MDTIFSLGRDAGWRASTTASHRSGMTLATFGERVSRFKDTKACPKVSSLGSFSLSLSRARITLAIPVSALLEP